MVRAVELRPVQAVAQKSVAVLATDLIRMGMVIARFDVDLTGYGFPDGRRTL